MTCAEVRGALEASVDGELQGPAARTLQAHLKTCADCARCHRAAAVLPHRLAALVAPALPDQLPALRDRLRPRPASPVTAGLLASELVLACVALTQLGAAGLSTAARAALDGGTALIDGTLAVPAIPAVPDAGALVSLLLLTATLIAHLAVIGGGRSQGA